MASIYGAEKGFKVEITIKDETNTAVNLTGATVIYSISIPDGTKVERTATLDNAISGITSYTTTSTTDFNVLAGKYIIQPKITLSNGNIFYGQSVEFECKPYYQ